MLARLQANELGVVGFHRQALELLLAAYNDTGPTPAAWRSCSAAAASLTAGQSQQPGTPCTRTSS